MFLQNKVKTIIAKSIRYFCATAEKNLVFQIPIADGDENA
jgi:hypothetical protein